MKNCLSFITQLNSRKKNNILEINRIKIFRNQDYFWSNWIFPIPQQFWLALKANCLPLRSLEERRRLPFKFEFFSRIWGLRLLPIIFLVRKILNEGDCCVDYHDFKDPEPVKLKVSPIYSSDLHDFKVKELSRKCQVP